jgi:AcrR family transcriptional regulator
VGEVSASAETAKTAKAGAGTAGKGDRTRAAILERAVDLASAEGLEGLTIGRLAAELKMSKSGLFAHFGSKQDLQLATVAAAGERFVATVVEPARSAPDGMPRLRAMLEAYLGHVDDYAGGCFWASTSAEYDDRPGPVRDAIAAALDAWVGALTRWAREAGVEDPERAAFELYSLVMGANSRYRMTGDRRVFDYALAALDRLEAEAAAATGAGASPTPGGSPSPARS